MLPLFLSAKRKWVLILKHEFPLETVSLNEYLKLQIAFKNYYSGFFFFEAAQNHIVVIFWFLSQPQIFKCQNLAKPPANVCRGHQPTKTANSSESLHSDSMLKPHPAPELGPTCAHAWFSCSQMELCGSGGCLTPHPHFPSPLTVHGWGRFSSTLPLVSVLSHCTT